MSVIVASTFGVAIGAVYAIVLPRFFPGWRTPAPWLLGIFFATLIGAYIGYRVPETEKRSTKIGFGLGYAVAVAGLVSYLSLFVILNNRGS